jgi:hypothetical protein
VYLACSSKNAYHDVWMSDSGDYFHMNLNRKWFCEYENNNGGENSLGDDSTTITQDMEKLICCSRMGGLEHPLGFFKFKN